MSKILEAVDAVFMGLMSTRIKQALLDAGNGIRHPEIMRRIELDEDDAKEIYTYKRVFKSLMDAGQICRTSSGFKRAEDPWRK